MGAAFVVVGLPFGDRDVGNAVVDEDVRPAVFDVVLVLVPTSVLLLAGRRLIATRRRPVALLGGVVAAAVVAGVVFRVSSLRVQTFGPTITHVDTERSEVALTFDDGPSRSFTPRVLRTLAFHDVEATFFMLGERVEKMPDIAQAVVLAGHEIGNHTWSHPSMPSLWKSQIRDEVCQTNEVIQSATGLRPTLFRPPFGRFAPSAVPLLGALGFDFILWSADGGDWDVDDPQLIADRIVRDAKPGSIILLHDSKALTVEALPLVIAGLRGRGFSIVPASELVGLDPYQESRGFSRTSVRR